MKTLRIGPVTLDMSSDFEYIPPDITPYDRSRNPLRHFQKYAYLRGAESAHKAFDYLFWYYMFQRVRAIVNQKFHQSLTDMKVLQADGNSESGLYKFFSDGKFFPVEDWLRENDGHFDSLFVWVCNVYRSSNDQEVSDGQILKPAKSSFLVYPTSGINPKIFYPKLLGGLGKSGLEEKLIFIPPSNKA